MTLKNSGFRNSLTSIIASSLLALSIMLPVKPVHAAPHIQEPAPQHEVCQEHQLCGRGVGFPNNPFYHRYLPREEMHGMIDDYMDSASQVADFIRLEILTYDWRTEEYVFNWFDYAYLVESAHEHGLDVVFLLDENLVSHKTKDFSETLDSDYTNPAIQDFLAVARVISMLFDGNPFPEVNHYQLMNEPDVKNMDPDAIAKILNESCSALEGNHIIAPGLISRNAVDYLQRVYESEAFDAPSFDPALYSNPNLYFDPTPCFDLAVHVYFGPQEVDPDLDELLAFSQQHNQDLIVSEYGRPSNGRHYQELNQLNYVFTMEDLFYSKGIRAHALYTLERSVFTGGFGVFSLEDGFNTTGRILTRMNGFLDD